MEELNLVEILKDCLEGTKLYSTAHGEVEFFRINTDSWIDTPIVLWANNGIILMTENGHLCSNDKGECILFPSKDNRDWSTFEVEKPKFDVKTLEPFDKVLARMHSKDEWKIDFFSHTNDKGIITLNWGYYQCIPYNDDTKHLLGTCEDAPEFYKTWNN